ncbi:MAG: glycosyltransferase family 1 protein [Rhizobiaceae bacterium]|nr:glycosyltransferase family 1 protein [Rhizobiaceae bacterium]
MKITILTYGTRGDVEPYLALAVGLRRAGHSVKLVAPSRYAEWVRSYGLDVHVQTVSVDERAQGEITQHGRANRVLHNREWTARLHAWLKQCMDDYWAASADADLILQGGFAYGGVDVALRRGVPIAFLFPHPFRPTREYMSYTTPLGLSVGERYNHLTHRWSLRQAWRTFGPPINQWRAERFNLPPWPSYQDMMHAVPDAPTLYAYSPHVIPKSADWTETDHVTGYWFVEPDVGWQPPVETVRFLEAGPPPIYIGFGSMRLIFPEWATKRMLEAVRQSGQRAVISVGAGSALIRLPAPAEIHFIDGMPHRWLFPRMAAIVHHGGAGTTSAVLNAGVPGIIVPIDYDQFGWSRRVRQLGVGLGSRHVATTTAGRLARMIRRAVEDDGLNRRAAALGETIRAERGIDSAIAILESYAPRAAAKRRGETT